MHCFGGVYPWSMKWGRQLVCQASKGDTINIWCPQTRYILSLIVNKINYSKVINITWSQGVQLCSLYPCPNKHLLKTFENIHTMERCLVWYPIVFPQNSRLLEWKLTAPTFNILQFLTITHIMPNTGQPATTISSGLCYSQSNKQVPRPSYGWLNFCLSPLGSSAGCLL